MMKRAKIFGMAVLTLGTAACFAEAQTPASGEPEDLMKRVEVAAVEAAHASRELRFSGTTRAAQRARLAFSVGSRMVARPVAIGDRVRRGQVLARLDELKPTHAVATARADLAEASARRAQGERDHARAEKLLAAKAATEEELERTAAAVDGLRAAEEAARARLDEARRQLDVTRLEAPFDGTVTDVFLEPGEYADAGTPVVMLSGDGDLELEVEVPESVIPRIAIGDEVAVLLPGLGEAAVAGRIRSIGRAAAGPGRLFPVVATLPPVPYRVVGATAELLLALDVEQALTLPVEAVVNPGGRRPVVFRVAGGGGPVRVEKVAVEVGALLSEPGRPVRVTVRGDLAVGDLVVTGGQRGLLDGETVRVEAGGAGVEGER